jgi:hypothetical protein
MLHLPGVDFVVILVPAKPFHKDGLPREVNRRDQPEMVAFYIENDAIIPNQIRRIENLPKLCEVLKAMRPHERNPASKRLIRLRETLPVGVDGFRGDHIHEGRICSQNGNVKSVPERILLL